MDKRLCKICKEEIKREIPYSYREENPFFDVGICEECISSIEDGLDELKSQRERQEWEKDNDY